ncbi:MAG: NYN domain-containing protein [Gemmatimonadaceae bacterium]
MNPRDSRAARVKGPVAPMFRGPATATAPASGAPFHHAPNAALLIDFDNVTMGIQKELKSELRALLSSDIIKGKVAVQRAYADWRRYPQYIVPLAESSIDMIMAPAYGSSKKNATDIRLAIDAMELVFTRPEIGTVILLSGDSDFSSLVIKLKEYGKYVIGVGIRESSSDLLVQNCDEYYSYNALAGLVKSSEEEQVPRDPWELAAEAIARMQRNGDVMRSDRLKQVMQDIDQSFDEKNLGMSKFSRFCQEAAQRGIIRITKLENGQMDVEPVEGAVIPRPRTPAVPAESPEPNGRRSRRGGRGRRDREPRIALPLAPSPAATTPVPTDVAAVLQQSPASSAPEADPPQAMPAPVHVSAVEHTGQRLTRQDAFDLVRRAVASLVPSGDDAVLASEVRRASREMLGRDSETLNERHFIRILRDAHDANVIDLRKRGDDYEVAPAAAAEPISNQLQPPPPAGAAGTAPASQAARSAANAASLRRGMGHRGAGTRGGRTLELPPDLFSVGVVDDAFPLPTATELSAVSAPPATPDEAPGDAGEVAGTAALSKTRRTRRGGRGRARSKSAPLSAKESATSGEATAKPARRSRAKKKGPAAPGDQG